MTITYVSAASASAESLTLPSHQAGDLLLLFAYRANSTAQPTQVSGWLGTGTSLGTTNFIGAWWKIATSSSEVSGTWTNTTQIACLVYRPASGYTLAVTCFSGGGGTAGVGGLITYPVFTQISTPFDSWLVGAAGHRQINTDIEVAPSGMTNRTSTAGGSIGELTVHDTNTTQQSWPGTSYTLTTGTSSGYRSGVVQIASMPVVASSGGLSPALINSQSLVRGIVL